MNNRVDDTVEHVINTVVLSELLIDEIEHLRDTPLWKQGVKSKGQQFLKELETASAHIIKVVDSSAAGLSLVELCRDYSVLFDAIRQMSAKDRIELGAYIEKNFNQKQEDNVD
jgi:hypothetical protein